MQLWLGIKYCGTAGKPSGKQRKQTLSYGQGSPQSTRNFDPCYLALGESPEERQIRYREYIQSAISDGEWAFIQEAVARGQLTGNGRYVEEVKKIMGRRIEHRRPGRPKTKQNGNRSI